MCILICITTEAESVTERFCPLKETYIGKLATMGEMNKTWTR